jgi:hypothetical protein
MYSTCSLVRDPIVDGRDPVNELVQPFSVTRFVSDPNVGGSVDVNEFELIARLVSWVKEPNCGGSDPASLFARRRHDRQRSASKD